MAFNAGSIEATLTLNRNPFTSGLALARKQGEAFAREKYEASAAIDVDQGSLNQARRQLRDFARESRQALARVNVDRLMFDRLVKDLREFGRQTYVARARVDVDQGSLRDLVDNMNRLNDTTESASQGFRRFGNEGDRAFNRVRGSTRLLLMTLPLLLPVAGSAITGIVGLVGGLISILGVAAIGMGAFAAVAVPTFKKIAEAVKAGQAEINKLPPGLREAGNELKGLQDHWKELVKATETPVGYTMAAGFRAAHTALAPLTPLIIKTAETLSSLGIRMIEYFDSDHYKDFVSFVTGNINPVLTRLFEIIVYGTRSVFNLTRAFMPLGQWLLDRISEGMQQFADWTGKLAGDARFYKWLELVKESLAAVWNFLVEVTKFLFNLSNALAPIGNIILGVLTDIFKALNQMPPEWLAAIAGGLTAIMAALLLGAGGPMAVVAGVIVGVAYALASLYDSSERVRGAIDPIVSTLRDIFLPVFQRLSDLFNQQVIPAFKGVGDTLLEDLLPAINDFLQATGPFIAFFTEQVGILAVDAIKILLQVFDYTLKEISSALRFWAAVFRGDWDTAWEEIKVSFGLKMGLIETLFGDMWNSIKTTMTEEGEILKTDWTGMWESFRTTMAEEGEILKTDWTSMWGNFKTTMLEEKDLVVADWTGMWESLKTTLEEEGELLKAEWTTMWSEIRITMQEEEAILDAEWAAFLASIRTTLVEEAELMKIEWNGIWPSMKTTAMEEWELIKIEWTGLWAGLKTTLLEEGEILKTEWLSIWPAVRDTAIEEWEIIKGHWNTFWGDVNTTARTEGDVLETETAGIWQSIKDTAIQEWEQIKTEISNAITDIKNTLVEEWEIIKTEWNNMLQSIKQTAVEEWNLIKAEFQKGVDAVKGVVNGMIDTINAVFKVVGVAEIPKLEAGGTVTMVPKFAKGGNLFDEIGPGFVTNGPKAIVGEGNSKYPEYVIPTDPKYRGRAAGLYKQLGSDIGYMQGGGILGGIASFLGLPSLDTVLGTMASGIGVTTGPWLDVAQGTARKAWDGIVKKIEEAIASLGGMLGGGGGGGGVDWMMGVLRSVFPGLALISGFRPGAITATGNASYHGMGRAVDVPPRMDVFNFIRSVFGGNTRELIFSPAGGAQVHNGSPHMYTGITRANHWDHVHWAFDKGGWLPPGLTPAMNSSGSPEAVLTGQQWDSVMRDRAGNADVVRKLDELIEVMDRGGNGTPTINNYNSGADPAELARRTILALRLSRR